MKSFLLIRNSGLAPIESFTILGLSTARGEADKIGQFGSGSKHGILALMRHGIQPRIFIGNDELIFSTHPARMGEKDYQEVRYTFKGEQHKTGMCLDFGALDWDSPAMAIREFVCNALDQGETISDCTGTADAEECAENETRVFIPSEDSRVSEYWGKLREFFLHFDGLETTPIIPARSENAQFFRRGVFVTERLASKSPALFAYNFTEGRIDESRNMDGAAMASVACRLLRRSQPHIETIFRTFSGEERWEHGIGNSMWSYDPYGRQEIAAAWEAVFGKMPFASNAAASMQLRKKNIAHIMVPHEWKNALDFSGIENAEERLTKLDSSDADECEPTETALDTFRRAWRWIEAARLTGAKTFPNVKCFTMPMKNGSERIGFYEKETQTVFLNLDYDTNEQAALEELAHYITNADDETRDFQDFAFKLATRIAKVRGIGQTTAPAEPSPVAAPAEAPEEMITAYFTFGQGHTHTLAGKTYDRNDVVKITASDPRARMVELFGLKWAFEYIHPDGPKMEYYPKGITDLSAQRIEPSQPARSSKEDDTIPF